MKSIIWRLAACIVLMGLTSGCVALVVGAGAGAAGYAYVRGELESTESASLDRTWKATQAAMKSLEFQVIKESKDALQAEMTARNASDKKISVKLKRISETSTAVQIRVGTFGDEAISLSILERIKKGL